LVLPVYMSRPANEAPATSKAAAKTAILRI
jgi:hypothetical protein